MRPHSHFPQIEELRGVLPRELESVQDLIPRVLLTPVEDFLRRPKKNLRGQLVELGFEFAGGDPAHERELISGCTDVLEMMHAGSLVIDDIQDGSQSRRGSPTLHERYGVPIALNAGNWLYFWPLEIVRELGFTPEREVQVYRTYHRTMLRAHIGQALDVGTPIDELPRDRIYDVCLTSLQLKTGALTAFAFALGAIAKGVDENLLQPLIVFGNKFGVALQMFDDLGNATGAKDAAKKWEDLRLRRPTWLWAALVEYGSPDLLNSLRSAVAALPDEWPLTSWFSANIDFIDDSYVRAVNYLASAHSDFTEVAGSAVPPKWWDKLSDLECKLAKAYR